MKYYVVSEEELKLLSERVWKHANLWYGLGINRPDAPGKREEAEAACRARPVGFLEKVVHNGSALWIELQDKQDG